MPKLHVQVSRLRTLLGDRDRLRFEHGTYRLRVLPDELDAERFVALADDAAEFAAADPARCVELSRKALNLWRGEPYPGVDTPTVADDAVRLRERRLVALETLYRAEFALDRHAAVLPEVTRFASAHPLHEPAHWLLITALYRSGRKAEAITTYRAVCHRLLAELDTEPGPELCELAHHLVAGRRLATVR